MVNWKASDATDRLVAAMIAAHPSIKLDYKAMAVMFGQEATYDAIEGRFRRYRKMAEDLKAEASSQGVTDLSRGRGSNSTGSTPRTPRGPRGGITKPGSSGRSRKSQASQNMTSPSKRGKRSGMSVMDAISLDDNDNGSDVYSGPLPLFASEPKHQVHIKDEILHSIAPHQELDTFMDPHPPASASSVASTAVTSKVETPENISSFASTFGGVKLDGSHSMTSLQAPGAVEILDERISNVGVGGFADDISDSAAVHPGRDSLEPVGMNQDGGIFNIPGFYYGNLPCYDTAEDLYGGDA
ncbi:hypothetical protein FE257_011266 [Aspergillus nanangensis]|uniref:Uncharacterized protein n=1 Tax=Aspergillus nanangensis TaxID=2582783 RepID=A0AAD4CHI5_ASPNN|nr:hypothetical protein FE257_011266 [Aspergillus nanangensis]